MKLSVGDRMTFLEELNIILNEEYKILQRLTELSFSKTNAIMEDQVDFLKEMVFEEAKLVDKLNVLENTRLYNMENWGVSKDTPISRIIESTPEDNKLLIKLQNNLNEELKRLKERNDINKKLIEENIQWIDFNLNLLSSESTPGNYGDETVTVNKNIFDRKV